jgi:hypothetical protein
MNDVVKNQTDLNSPQTNIRPKGNPKIFLTGAVVSIFIAFSALAFYIFNNNSNQDKVTNANQVPHTTDIKSFKDVYFVFYRDDELWASYFDASSEKITSSNGTIYDYDYSPQNSTLAYVTGKKIINEHNSTFIEPDTVILHSLNDNAKKIIYKKSSQYIEGYDAIDSIKDIKFVNNGKTLAITTLENLFFYDFEKDSISTIFNTPFKRDGEFIDKIYAYINPILSPSGDQTLLTSGHYEGNSYHIIENTTGNISKLPYFSYVSGTSIIGWISNTELAAVKRPETEHDGFEIFKISYPSLDETLLFSLDSFFNDGFIKDGYLYISVVDSFSGYANENTIYKINLNTNEVNKLLENDKYRIDLRNSIIINEELITEIININQNYEIINANTDKSLEKNASLHAYSSN